MGLCINCGKDIYFKNGEYKCDNCGVQTKYFCWNCKKIIDIKKLSPIYKDQKECSWCGFFICPNCKNCGRKKINDEFVLCERIECLNDLHDDLKIGIKPKKSHIIQILGNLRNGKKIKYCIRNIPITHAKGKIKDYYLLMEGWKKKNENDVQLFRNRYNKITDEPIGNIWTISSKREDGTHGFEVREACNVATCFGICSIKKNDNGFIEYERIDEPICEFWNKNGIIKKYCPKCKEIYDDMKQEYCYECLPYKKGKNVGKQPELKIKNTNVSTCDYKRIDFKEEFN